MAAKPMKLLAYDGETHDAQTVDTCLIRMTMYLRLTKTDEKEKINTVSSYFDGVALKWFIGKQTTLLAGTFEEFKTSLCDHFVP